MTDLTFWFDPRCPWCWITSRWIEEVKDQRGITVVFKPFSLLFKNEPEEDSEYYERARVGTLALRVCEAARERGGDEAVAALYTQLGAQLHHDENEGETLIPQALADAGLDADLAEAAGDERWDEAIRASMDEALEAAGDDIGVPLIRFGGRGEPAFFGPVIAERLFGQEALDLYDGFVKVNEAGKGGFYEIKRTRDIGPQVGERPS